VPPRLDLAAEKSLAEVLINATRDELVDAAHDLSEGGLVQGLVESCLRFGVGAKVSIAGVTARDGVTDFEALFSESTARALVSVPRGEEVRFVDACVARGVPHLKIGEAGHSVDGVETLEIDGVFTLPLDEAREVHGRTLPAIFG